MSVYSCTPEPQGPGNAKPEPGASISTLIEVKRPMELSGSLHCLYYKCQVPKQAKDLPHSPDKEEEATVERPPKAKEKGNNAARGAQNSQVQTAVLQYFFNFLLLPNVRIGQFE